MNTRSTALALLALAPAAALAQQAPPEPRTPIADAVGHYANKAAGKVGQYARAAEAAARGAADEAKAWAHRAAAAANRPRGLLVFTPPAPAVTSEAPPAIDWTPGADYARPLPARVVVLVHGLDEEGGIWNELAPGAAGAGHTVIRFDYPNDQPLAHSAGLLAEALRELHGRGVARVDLVCHSMGGLVARDVLTRPGAYAGDGAAKAGLPAVERFIMLGTPNGGSSWAYFEPVTEAREQVARWLQDDDDDPRQLLGFLADGRGEAGRDLLPGSEFLIDLNSRPVPTGVAITNIIGEVRPTGEAFLPCLTAAGPVSDVLGEGRARAVADALRSAAAGLGDAVVPISSAELAGVEDTVRVCASHRGMLRASKVERLVLNEPLAEAAPAIPVILDRLARPAPGAATAGGPGPAKR